MTDEVEQPKQEAAWPPGSDERPPTAEPAPIAESPGLAAEQPPSPPAHVAAAAGAIFAAAAQRRSAEAATAATAAPTIPSAAAAQPSPAPSAGVPTQPIARRSMGIRRGVSRIVGAIAALAIGAATAIVVLAVAMLLFLNPWWVSNEQDRAEAGLLTGYGPVELELATDSILHDLVIGPPRFDVTIGNEPVLNEREQSHMRDVRAAFVGFTAITFVSAVFLLIARFATRGSTPFWRRVRRGGRIVALVVVLLGLFAIVAFNTAFEVFHELLFPAGSYSFDPATDRLVQLFPLQFWYDTAAALAVTVVILGLAVAWLAERRIRANGVTPEPQGAAFRTTAVR